MASIKLKGDTSGEITIQAPSDAGTNTINLQASSGTLATTAQASIGTKNLIINGNMQIAQRGTSATGKTTSGYYTCDRWHNVFSGAGTWTFTQDTDVPSGQGFAKSLKVDVATADSSLDADDGTQIEHRVEGQNLQYLNFGNSSAKSLTLSFWVKSNKTGTYVVRLTQPDASSRMVSFAYTISSASTWEKKIIEIPADTGGTINNDNGAGLNITWWLSAGTSYTSGSLASTWQSYANGDSAVGQVNLADNTANEWYITGIQLEAGTTASDFEFLPHDVNLQRCFRYCQKLTYDSFFLPARTLGGDRIDFSLYINSPFRATPSLTENLTAFTLQYNNTTTAFSSSSISIVHSTFDNVALRFTATSTVTEPRVGVARPTGNFILDAEL